MSTSNIKLILCDLGNVLINFDHRIAVRKVLNFTDKTFEEAYQLFFDSPVVKDFEEGRISPEVFFKAITVILDIKNLSFDKFIQIWNEIFFDNEGMVEILRCLKKNYTLHLISNINELHYKYTREKFPHCFEVFDKLYLSYEVGSRKPAEEIYRRAVEEKGFRMEDALYVDDRADLIQEAKKLGLKSILFKNTGDFKKSLKAMKVIF